MRLFRFIANVVYWPSVVAISCLLFAVGLRGGGWVGMLVAAQGLTILCGEVAYWAEP